MAAQRTPEPTMDALRHAYAKTALARMNIPFECAMRLESVRIAIEGSARRQPHPAAAAAHNMEAA